ncbi:MAG: fibronectin type III domain-containing protein [Euryarchaeota archaeon]|nr:fibronectin type III domain-containing protein [Euryarchaeota archaeon]
MASLGAFGGLAADDAAASNPPGWDLPPVPATHEGNVWTNMNPAGGPVARAEHAMAYDAESDRVVMFGGYGTSALGDTWTYNLNTNEWRNMNPTVAPSPRAAYPAMAYHSGADRIILFGGQARDAAGDPVANGETWAYDYNANTWTNVNPTGAPSPRFSHGMAYDAESDRVILFGGFTGNYNGETWAYHLQTNTWTNMRPATAPSPRSGMGMAYDAESDRVILFGGYRGVFDGETWAYDYNANTWTNVNPSGAPASRIPYQLVYHDAADVMILFGGFSGVFRDDTWAYDDETNTWTNVNPPTHPAGRSWHGMAYDHESLRVVLFGGNVQSGATTVPTREVWSYEFYRVPGDPAPPRGLLAFRGNQQVELAWQPPFFTGGFPLTEYRIYRGTASGSLAFLAQVPPTDTTYSDLGLTNDVTYFYAVTATNAVGESPRSNEVSATPAAVPSAPRNVQAVGGDRRVNLSWDAPADDGGFPVTGYRVYRGTRSGGLAPIANLGAVFAYNDSGVVNGVPYYYQISAVNQEGEGLRSPELVATPAAVPSAPQDLRAAAFDRTVDLSWSPPADDGGATITSYRVYRGTAPGAATFLAELPELSYADGGLTNGQTYYYEVAAVNRVGEGVRSPEVSATPTAVPSAPRNVTAGAGDGEVRLAWEPPLVDGGNPITEYRIYRGQVSVALAPLASTTGLEFQDSAVQNGQTYFYGVSAANVAGEGPLSETVSAVPRGAPSAPRDLQAIPADRSAILSWSPPLDDGGASIQGYRISRGQTSGNLAFLVEIGDVTTHTDPGLTNGQRYYYAVAAFNEAGEGQASAEVTVVAGADTTDPTVAIVSPPNGATLATTTVTVTGTASDDVGLAVVELSTDGVTWAPAEGLESWSGTLTLRPGSNTIRALATDLAGNTATTAIAVTVVTEGVSPAAIGVGLLVLAMATLAAFLLFRQMRRGKKEA